MREISDFRFASTPPEAVELMRQGPGRGIYLAGSIDLFVIPPECDFVVDISRAGISNIVRTPEGDLFLGAGVPLQDLATNELVTSFAGGVLSRAASRCGHLSARGTATVGGNLCQTLSSAELAPVLLALDATCFITDVDSQESLPLVEFFAGPGKTVLEDRLLVGLVLSCEAAERYCAHIQVTRSGEDTALVQVAVGLDVVEGRIHNARVAFGAAAPVPMRSVLAETALDGVEIKPENLELLTEAIDDAARLAGGESDPLDDERCSAEYRRELVRVLTRRLLEDILGSVATDGTSPQGGESL